MSDHVVLLGPVDPDRRVAAGPFGLVKPVLGRRILIAEAHMPLAEHGRVVARPGKEFGDSHLILRQSSPPGAGEIDFADAYPDIVAAGVDSETGGGTRDFRIVLKEPHPLARHLVQVWRRGAAQLAAAVDT